MANLRVDKITSTETFEKTGSVQFDGTGDYLEIDRGSDTTFALGTDDFTIEMWVYRISNGAIISTADNGAYDRGAFALEETGNFVLSEASGTVFQTFTAAVDTSVVNTWVHYAFVRKDNVVSCYEDGKLRVRQPTTINITYSDTNDLAIGARRTGGSGALRTYSNFFEGHISNVRIIKGKALYTANFKPSMKKLEVTSETVLLACQSKTDATLEKTGKTITANGNAVASELTPGILTPVPKSGGGSAITGSVEFDGTGDYLSLAANSDFNFGSDNFTIEGFFYKGGAATLQTLLCSTKYYIAGNNGNWILRITNDNTIAFASYDGTGNEEFNEFSAPSADRGWHHFAFVREGTGSNQSKFYFDGVLAGSTTISKSLTDAGTNGLRIGEESDSGPGNNFMNGFLSNIRIVKGTALYTDDFVPPTRELKKVPGTVLLCCQDENSVTTEATGKTITSNGDPAASNFTPQVGDDRKVTFEGVTKINSDAYFYLPTGDTVTRDTRSGRGIFGGGESPSRTNAINFIQIQSTGNAQDFGDLTGAKSLLSACASSTRGIFGGGYLAPPSTYLNVMEFVTMASTGDALDFGDLSVDRQGPGSCSNSTRGVFAGGSDPGNLNTIDFVTIASTGDATDFGDLITKRAKHKGCGSSIRAIIFSPEPGEDIQFFNYASTGRATSFGEMTPDTKGDSGAASDSTRALRFGGNTHPAGDIGNNISYITISSTGNEQEFGDLSATGSVRGTAMSNSIRAVQILNNNGSNTNAMEYVTIQSTGNGKDFGDLNTTNLNLAGSTSDSHGGLG